MSLEDAIAEKVLKGVSINAFKNLYVRDGKSYSLEKLQEFKFGLEA